jgi:hypothetical protein
VSQGVAFSAVDNWRMDLSRGVQAEVATTGNFGDATLINDTSSATIKGITTFQVDENTGALIRLYNDPDQHCGSGPIPPMPPSAGTTMEDLVAAFVFVEAEDIHCPTANPKPNDEGTDIPDRWYTNLTGYLVTRDAAAVGDHEDADARATLLYHLSVGMTRMFLAYIPALSALGIAVISLLYSLSLMLIWLSMPIVMLFIAFQRSASALGGLVRAGLQVFQASLISSIVIGLIIRVMESAVLDENVGAYIGWSIIGLLIVLFLFGVSVSTFMMSISTLVSTATGAVGAATMNVMSNITGGAVSGAAALATGGAALAIGGAATSALKPQREPEQEDKQGIAHGANSQRGATPQPIIPVMRAGEVSASMLDADDSDLTPYRARGGAASLTDQRQQSDLETVVSQNVQQMKPARDDLGFVPLDPAYPLWASPPVGMGGYADGTSVLDAPSTPLDTSAAVPPPAIIDHHIDTASIAPEAPHYVLDAP